MSTMSGGNGASFNQNPSETVEWSALEKRGGSRSMDNGMSDANSGLNPAGRGDRAAGRRHSPTHTRSTSRSPAENLTRSRRALIGGYGPWRVLALDFGDSWVLSTTCQGFVLRLVSGERQYLLRARARPYRRPLSKALRKRRLPHPTLTQWQFVEVIDVLGTQFLVELDARPSQAFSGTAEPVVPERRPGRDTGSDGVPGVQLRDRDLLAQRCVRLRLHNGDT